MITALRYNPASFDEPPAQESPSPGDVGEAAARMPPIADALAEASPTDVLDKEALARRLKKSMRTIERRSQDGDLPPPSFVGRAPLWVWGDVVEHLLKRQGRPKRRRPRRKPPARKPDGQMKLAFS
jgi:hypothetical protein